MKKNISDHIFATNVIYKQNIIIKDLRKIAESERFIRNAYYSGIDYPLDPSEDDLKEARDQLAEEYPEAFDDPN